MRFLLSILVLVSIFSTANATVSAWEKPVMVIRFTQDNIDYFNLLQEVVSKTHEVKPMARFNIVTTSAQKPTKKRWFFQQDAQNDAMKEHTNLLVQTLQQLGIRQDKINVEYQHTPLPYQGELAIYVK